MTIDLSGPRAKIERAEEHLNALYSELDAFIKRYADREIVYHTFDGTWHTVSVGPVIDESPPLRWSIICGDAIHNLGSALDHLVWQLVLAGGNKPGRHSSFPIYTDAKNFSHDVRFRKKKRGPGPLEGIDPRGQAWAAIEEAQPYNSRNPRTEPLFALNELDIMDKHRTLLINMLFPDEDTIRGLIGWDPDAHLLEYRVTPQPLSLEHETEILRLRFSETWPDPHVNMYRNLAIEPTFGNEALQIPAEMLGFLYSHVSDLIESFQ